MAFCGVEGDNDSTGLYLFCKLAKKVAVDLAFAKGRAADDDLVRAPLGDFLGASLCSNI